MSTDRRAAALEQLRSLHDRLKTESTPAREAMATECELLIKAVETFHMEGIRFRMYGLHRRMTSDSSITAEAVSILEAARAALNAAGFKIR